MSEPARTSEIDDTVVPLRPRHPEIDHDQVPDPLLRDVFGAVLRQARHDQQRTLADVADRAGVSVPYLSEMERGRKDPSSEMLAAVCRALDLDLIDLVARSYREVIGHRVETAQRLTADPGASRRGEVLALAA